MMHCPNCQSTDVTLIQESPERDEYRCNRCGRRFDVAPDAGDAGSAPDADIIDDAGDTDDGL